ncbi:MAG: hypothetical protein PHN37_02440, partial [Candidatus Pacebacteria bacterium]|nr:hypothetical protein [Candidatus Paceibacterota bacterium]
MNYKKLFNKNSKIFLIGFLVFLFVISNINTLFFNEVEAVSNTITLSPVGIGRYNDWGFDPSSMDKWITVSSDDGDTERIKSKTDRARQTFIFPNAGISDDSNINSIALYVVAKGNSAKIKLLAEKGLSGSERKVSDKFDLNNSYKTKEWVMDKNPFTNESWTIDEINSWTINFGVENDDDDWAYVTQIYIIINYSITCIPTNGGWSDWSAWSDWSNTGSCGDDEACQQKQVKSRTRTCTNPEPACGGTECEGDEIEYDYQYIACGLVNGGWSDWSAWSDWSNTGSCGDDEACQQKQVKSRTRTCTNPEPACGGTECEGDEIEYDYQYIACGLVNGGWSDWS